ncbi:MAG: hypothetical protein JWM74_1058 [Myxococcaceae bacterium]|nr:hypothetical protein [Myxococcaceae bacterium]
MVKKPQEPPHSRHRSRWLLGVVLGGAAMGAACSTGSPSAAGADESVSSTSAPLTHGTTVNTPIGLAFEIENGVGKPLSVRAGQLFFVNQIDVRAAIDTQVEEGVRGLARDGDFANLEWKGVSLADEEAILLANPDGTFTRRRFFRDARWMKQASDLVVEQVDARGSRIGHAVTVHAGVEGHREASDSFFDRRLRAIQWTYDCRGPKDCEGATKFSEEGLVELRYQMHEDETFRISPHAKALRVSWSLKPSAPWTVPLTQVTSPDYDYGFAIDVTPLTPPAADGTYAPGSDIELRVTLRDGAGKRLHPEGSLPTYNEVVLGEGNAAGIQYYRAFFDPTTTYYRRKHRERMMMSQLVGPMQQSQPIRSVAELEQFLGPDDVQTTGTLERDGVFAQFRTFPTSHDLFGGAFDPSHAGWSAPVPDTWTYHLPANAPPGTYQITTKARRIYLGQDLPKTSNVPIQVGTPTPTHATLNTGPCNSCHSGPSALGTILHGNDQRANCAGCHVPLGFELEGPIYVRTHFIHSRSNRVDAPRAKCASCHLDTNGIQRTSKSACLSCHKSYPQSHVDQFGPIESMYVGGGRESFQQCTSTCHVTHPRSGL